MSSLYALIRPAYNSVMEMLDPEGQFYELTAWERLLVRLAW